MCFVSIFEKTIVDCDLIASKYWRKQRAEQWCFVEHETTICHSLPIHISTHNWRGEHACHEPYFFILNETIHNEQTSQFALCQLYLIE